MLYMEHMDCHASMLIYVLVIHNFGNIFIHVQIFFDNPMPRKANTPILWSQIHVNPLLNYGFWGVFHIRATQKWL